MRKDWPSPAKGWLTSGEVPADEMPALQELLRVALRFREKAASQADLDVGQEEFDLTSARAKMVKKKADKFLIVYILLIILKTGLEKKIDKKKTR